ncbi:MAG: anti-sigma F factor [Lachnospiraceae bacterium]
MNITNKMEIEFTAKSENESFARMSVIGFIAYLNPTMEALEDIKIAISEAVTNAIIHGYQEENTNENLVKIRCYVTQGDEALVYIEVEDTGVGIENIVQSIEPMYSSALDDNRAGMGFSFMEAFMDGLEIESQVGVGTTISLCKKIKEYGK